MTAFTREDTAAVRSSLRALGNELAAESVRLTRDAERFDARGFPVLAADLHGIAVRLSRAAQGCRAAAA